MIQRIVLSCVLISTAAAGCAHHRPVGGAAAHAQGFHSVRAATDGFYAALQAMFKGDATPMKDAWWHDDEVTYMGPGGDYLVGWADIEKEWDLQASRTLGGKVEPKDLNTIEVGDMALINCVEVGTNVVDGKEATVSIRSSTVFRRHHGMWKVIAHQTDKLPYLEAAH